MTATQHPRHGLLPVHTGIRHAVQACEANWLHTPFVSVFCLDVSYDRAAGPL